MQVGLPDYGLKLADDEFHSAVSLSINSASGSASDSSLKTSRLLKSSFPLDDDSSSWPEDEACGGFLSAASDRHGLDPPKSPSPLPRDPLADRFPDEPSEESKSLISFLDLDLAEATISDPRRPRLVPPRRRGDNSPLPAFVSDRHANRNRFLSFGVHDTNFKLISSTIVANAKYRRQ